MLSLRSDLGLREFKDVKVMIFLRGEASYLYSTAITIRGSPKETERRLGPSWGWLWSLQEIPSTQRNLWEEFLKVAEASVKPQSQSKSSRVKETWTHSKNLRECLDFLEDGSEDFEEIPSTWRKLWEGFPKATEVRQSYRVIPSWVEEALNIVFRLW